MTELEKMQRAKMYIDKMANGINPIDDISSEKRTSMNGEYVVVVYGRDAQQFILDNIEAIVANISNASTKKADNQGQAWTAAHEECLVDLFNKNVPVSEIAATLMRTETGIRAKLKKMGLIDNRSDAR